MATPSKIETKKEKDISRFDLPPDYQQKKIRYLCIDVFRGLAIAAMIFVNTLSEFSTTPAWSKHAIDFGLTYVDLVAPFFIFAIALTYRMSFKRYLKNDGALNAYIRILRRYGALLGFGFLGSLFITSEGINFGWAVLQAIGLAGIFTLFLSNYLEFIDSYLGSFF